LTQAPLQRFLRLAPVWVFFFMPTDVSIPDAEDLKARVRELRRFL
jgi:hypothetical protein